MTGTDSAVTGALPPSAGDAAAGLGPWWLRMSARRLLPLLLIVFAVFTIGLRYLDQMGTIVSEVSAQEAVRLRERLAIDQARLELRLGVEDRLFVRRLVGALALHDGVERAYLLSGDGRIQASLSRLDLGQTLSDGLLAAQAQAAELALLANGPMPRALDVRTVAGGAALAASVPLKDGYRLVVWQDLHRPLALRRAQMQAELLREAVVFLVAVGALAMLLHLLWFRRAQALAQALAAIGAGDLSVRAKLQGRDELAHIGEVADRMAQQLQRDQQRLRHMNALVNRSPAVVIEWAHQPGWPVLQVSDAVRQWGYEPEQLLSGALHFNDLLHPDDRVRVNAEVARYFEHGPDSYRQEYRIRCADGRWAWVDDRTTLTRDASGAVHGICGVLLDITPQKQAEQAQRDQAEVLRLFFDLPFLGMAVSSPTDKRWLQVNDRLCEILGYSREELLRMSWTEMTPPGDLERNLELFDELIAGRRNGYQLAKRFVRKDGRIVHTEIDVKALREPDGRIRQLYATVQDVTERTAAEEALRRSQAMLLRAQEIARMGSWSQDLHTGVFTWSPQTYVIHEVEPDDQALDMDRVLARVHPDDADRTRQRYEEALAAGGQPYDIRYRLRMTDGRVKHLLVKVAFEFESGQAVRSVGMVVDETELLEAQRDRDRLVSVMENTTDIVCMGDLQGRPLYFNRAAEQVLGLSRDEKIDNIVKRVHPAWAAQRVLTEGVPAAIREGRWLAETAVLDAQGRELPVSQLLMPHRGEDGQVDYLWTILRDISERKAVEAALELERTQLAQAQAVARVGSWTLFPADHRLVWSDEQFRLLGYAPRTVEPCWAAFFASVHPDDRAMVQAHLERDLQARVSGVNRFEHRIVTAQGLRHVEQRANVEVDEQGQVVRIIGTTMDITEAVLAKEQLRQANQELERRVAERTAQLRQANQELEAFSYTVSHDLKAPLRGIDGYSQLLLEEYGPKLDEEGRHFVQRVRHGVQLMSDLINDLLAYSRMERRDMARDSVALLPLVQQVIDGFEADIRRQGTQVRLDLPPMTLALDREGMAVVMRNLVGNALKFSRDSRPPVVVIGGQTLDGSHRLWVRDNGVGFDMKYHDRMFAIFQRLHRAEDFAGTGVGLALVAKAVQRMGGRVWAESAPGAGATFFLEFPA